VVLRYKGNKPTLFPVLFHWRISTAGFKYRWMVGLYVVYFKTSIYRTECDDDWV